MIAIAAADPSPAAVMTWARGFTAFPAAHTPGTVVRPSASTTAQPCGSISAPRPVRKSLLPTNDGRTNTAVARHQAPVAQLDAGQAVVLDDDPGDGAFDDADGAGGQLLALLVGERGGVGEEHDVVGSTAGSAARAGPASGCRRARRASGRGPRGRGSRGSAGRRCPTARRRRRCRRPRRAGRSRPGGAGRHRRAGGEQDAERAAGVARRCRVTESSTRSPP